MLPVNDEMAYNEFRFVRTKKKQQQQQQKAISLPSLSFLSVKILGYNVFGYNDASPISNQFFFFFFFVTRRVSCSDVTFRNVHADIRAKPVVHPGQTVKLCMHRSTVIALGLRRVVLSPC